MPFNSKDIIVIGGTGGGGDFLANGSVPMTGDLNLNGNDINNVNSIGFDTTPTAITPTEGALQWNATDGTLNLGMNGGAITQQIGQESFIKVRNSTGSTIANGTVVYFSGSLGNRPTVALAKSDSATTSMVQGISTEDIPDNTDGFITTAGYVRQIKTDYTGSGAWGTTWASGDILYVSKITAGQLTNLTPAVPHHSDIVGSVGVLGPAGTGSILVNIARHQTMEDLSDVNGTPLTTSGQIPVWNQTNGYFDFSDNINNKQPIDAGLTSLSALTGAGYVKATATDTFTQVTTIPNTDITGLGTLSTQNGTFSGTHSGTSSGTNTGDQTSIVGITGTKVQYNTSVTDGDFMYVGDAPTAHTHTLSQVTDVTMTVANLNSLDDGVNSTLHFHDSDRARANHTGTQTASTISDFTEASQDATGAMVDTSLVYVDATPLLQRAALTGAITASAGSNNTALGSFTTAQLNTALTDNDIATGGGTATGTNTGDQTITLTSDVTGSGTGSFATTIAANAVGLTKMADVATSTVFYRKTAGTGDPEVQTLATLKTDLGLTGTNSGDQTITNTSNATSHTVTLSATGGSVQLVEGANITLTTTGTGADGIVTIASTGGGGPLTVQDEGSTQSTTVTTLNFTGAGVTASGAGATATINISGGGGGGVTKGIAEIDFGANTQESDVARVTVTDASISATSYPIASPYAIATTDHDPDDYSVEGISATISNIVVGVSFDIVARAPNLTFGKYKFVYHY